jgi:hypothetical protein
MGTVTQYNLANVQAALGGANPISMSEYYRGGAYVPTSRTTTVRQPTSGSSFSIYSTQWLWTDDNSYTAVQWSGTTVFSGTGNPSTVTSGIYTYYKADLRTTAYSIYTGQTFYYYALYRTSSSTSAINTGVPSSGTISISQLYGAANP